jgi:hypothetical protein
VRDGLLGLKQAKADIDALGARRHEEIHWQRHERLN